MSKPIIDQRYHVYGNCDKCGSPIMLSYNFSESCLSDPLILLEMPKVIRTCHENCKYGEKSVQTEK